MAPLPAEVPVAKSVCDALATSVGVASVLIVPRLEDEAKGEVGIVADTAGEAIEASPLLLRRLVPSAE